MYLFLAVLGLDCCTWNFSSCSEQGLLFVVVLGLLTAVASLVERGLSGARALVMEALGLSICSSRALEHRLSSCGTQA